MTANSSNNSHQMGHPPNLVISNRSVISQLDKYINFSLLSKHSIDNVIIIQ